MSLARIIPFLLIDSSGLVKTINFKGKRYIGDPINAVKIFNEKFVDELVLLDIEASLKKQQPNFKLIQEIASEAFMPIGYGGGVSKIDHFDNLFAIGVEKVSVNSSLFENPDVVREAVRKYGSQSIVASLDFKKNFLRKYIIFSKCGTKKQKYNVENVIDLLKELGVGELTLNNIDYEGRMKGYDLGLIKTISSRLTIPVTALGGAGNVNDFKLAIEHGASSAGAGSMFIYQGPHKAVLISYIDQDQVKKISNVIV